MARKVRDASLDNRSARGRLKIMSKPYYRLMEPGLHLGYRKLPSGPGSWIARRYTGDGRYTVINLVTDDGARIMADDYDDADGHTILSFAQAQAKAKEMRAKIAADIAGPYTVKRVMAEYLDNIEKTGRPLATAQWIVRTLVLPKLGTVEAEFLTTKRLQDWLHETAAHPKRDRKPRGKKGRGLPQTFKPLATDPESVRRRKSSANRTFAVVRAALNRAWRAGKITSDAAWRRVEVYQGVDGVRTRYLSVPEVPRFVNACTGDFRKLAQGALVTGARYGQLGRLVAADFNPAQNTVRVTSRKGRGIEKTYYATLTDEGATFFRDMCAGLASTEIIFKKPDGTPWTDHDQTKPIADACRNAKIAPIGINGLRHTWASLSVMAGMPLILVARNLGHSDTKMVEKHYGHLAPSFVTDTIRAHAPSFGFERESVVVAMH